MISSLFAFFSSCREYEKAKEEKEAVFPLVCSSVLNAAGSIFILIALTLDYHEAPYLYGITYMFHLKMIWFLVCAGIGVSYMYIMRRNNGRQAKNMSSKTIQL